MPPPPIGVPAGFWKLGDTGDVWVENGMPSGSVTTVGWVEEYTGYVAELDGGKKLPTVDVSDPVLDGWRCPFGRVGGTVGLKLGPSTGRNASAGASWRYLAFFRTPSWQLSARPRRTQRWQGRSSPERERETRQPDSKSRYGGQPARGSSRRGDFRAATVGCSRMA